MTDRTAADALWPVPAGLRLRHAMALAFAAGALSALGQAPWGIWGLTLLGLGVVFALSRAFPRWRDVAVIWWAAGTGYFGLALSWIIEPFLVDAATHGWMAPFALVFMAGGLALFWGAAGALARRLTRGTSAGFAAASMLALTLAGVLRGVVFTGFPWALPGHVLIDTPVLMLAQWGGAIGLTLLVLGFAVAWPLCLARPLHHLPIWGLAGVAVFAIGHWTTPPLTPTEDRPIVRLVQPNVPQAEKWDPLKAPGHFDRLLDMTRAPGRRDLTVWPETAVPAWLSEVTHLMPVISEAAGNGPLVFGINRGEGQRIYNALVLLTGAGDITQVYDKHHLVPFGEYIPLGDLLGGVGLNQVSQSAGYGFSPGPGARLIDLPGIGPTLPLICYEGIFARDIAAAPARPALLLLITNDAWFGTVSGPYQHLAQAQLRSVEQGLPMVRVANTGVSAMIDPAGRMTGVMPLGEPGVRDVALPAARPPTLYARLGDWPFALVLIAGLAWLGIFSRKNPT